MNDSEFNLRCNDVLSAPLPKMYVPLHVHTAKGSVGDSILKMKEYIKKAKEMGLTHLSVTNHGSMKDMYDFYYACLEEEITPIIGCEVYEAADRTVKLKGEEESFHLVLIAKNEIGLKNLLYICTDAQLTGFYYRPRTDLSVLREHGEGIIALSACLGAKIPKILNEIQEGVPEEEIQALSDAAVEAVNEYKSIFDEFYLEIQPGNFEQQIRVNEMLVDLAEITDTKLVVTNDVHYLDQEDWFAHDIHVKIARKQKIEDPVVYPDRCYYLQNYNTIIKSFPYLEDSVVEEAIKNTVRIAYSCNLKLPKNNIHMPRFGVPDGHTEESYLSKLSFQHLEAMKNVIKDPVSYATRLIYELEVICELGFAGYFLTVRDFVLYAKKSGIPVGPGRGSVCGSLVAFLCDITKVDPIKYDLLFERFLSIHRKGSIPDVDLDFSADKREQMFNYAVTKHGVGRCALVSTSGIRKAKASLRDTARVFNIQPELADEAAKLIPVVYYDDEGEKQTDLSITDSIAIIPRLQQLADEYPEWFDMAIKLEDLPRTESIHAAGTLVSPVDLMDYIPLVKPNNENINATALNLGDAEKAGFVKFDFLSLATLAVIDATEIDVGYKFDFIDNDFDDEDTWNLIGSKHTTSLFQIASRTYKDRMHRLRPKTIEQLAACLALVRGPCISSGDDKKYMEIIEGTREIDLIHPFYDDVTKDTLGVLLYQEQLMQVSVNFGFSLEESFHLMKAVAKKKIDKIKAFEEKFYDLANQRGVPIEATDKVWKIIVDAGLYCFNKSHAVAYALLCYQSAFLKAHFPVEYLKNALTNAYARKEEISEVVQECRRMAIKFAPLSVNDSMWEFSLEEDHSIRIGMCAVRSFGEAASAEVISKRPFDSVVDFMDRIEKSKCSKRSIVPAIFSGMFNCFSENRHEVFTEFCAIRKDEVPEVVKLQGGGSFKVADNYGIIEELILGAQLMCNPVNDFTPVGFEQLKAGAVVSMQTVIRKAKKLRDRNNNMMAFLTLETADGYIDCTVFAEAYSKFKSYCKKDLVCTIIAKKDKEDSCIVVGFD